MNQVNFPVCGKKCVKAGKTKAGSQRWLCRDCRTSLTHKIDNSAKELNVFLDKYHILLMPPMSAIADVRTIDGGFPYYGFSVTGFPVNGFSSQNFCQRHSDKFSPVLNSIIYPIYYIAGKAVYAHVLDILQFSMKA